MRGIETTSSDGRRLVGWVSVLGRQDSPADGVEDYCDFLARALSRQGINPSKMRVPWAEQGWLRALRELWRESASWRGQWVLLQYTALAWSRRGISLGALAAAWIVKRRGARLAVVLHEASAQPGRGVVGGLRERLQDFVVRRLHRAAARSIFTVPIDSIAWLHEGRKKAVFIPIGANIPEAGGSTARAGGDAKTVVVFCLTPGPNRQIEIQDTVHAVRAARDAGVRLRLVVLGRSTAEAREEIERGLAGSGVEVSVRGMVLADEVSRILSGADAQLFVCGHVSQRRGSALAGIACGLPVVGYAGSATGSEIEDAGLELAPYRDPDALGRALTRVLTDDELNARLRERSRAAQRRHFSWDAIGEKYAVALDGDRGGAPLRMLIYAEYFLPVIGGVQTAVNVLARGLCARGAQVTLVTRTRERVGDDSEFPFPIVRHPGLSHLYAMIRGAGVIHVAGPCLAPMAIAWLLGKPYVVEHHGYQAICPNGLLFRQPSQAACPGHFMAGNYGECWTCRAATIGSVRGLRSLLLTFPRHWLCTRAAVNIGITRHVCERHGLPRSRPIYYGIEPVAMANGNGTPVSSAPGEVTFAYVGRLVAEKGLPLLVEAAARLRDEGVAFRLTFIGDGPERAMLERRVDEHRLRSAATFTGDLRGAVLERAVRHADVVVMPSVWEETAGLSAIEQMMRGRVVVAANIGGLGEVVGDAGLKFAPRDVEALAALLRQAAMKRDEMSEIGRAARERADRMFGVDRMVVQHEEVYREVAK